MRVTLAGQPQGFAPTEHEHRYIKATAFGKPERFFPLVPKLQSVGLLFPKLQLGKPVLEAPASRDGHHKKM